LGIGGLAASPDDDDQLVPLPAVNRQRDFRYTRDLSSTREKKGQEEVRIRDAVPQLGHPPPIGISGTL
jgi:hypothetical protein